MNILIIDDSILYKKIFRAALADVCSEARVHDASCSDSAFSLIESEEYGLILLDIVMNTEKSFGLLKKIATSFPELPVVVLSSPLSKKWSDTVNAMNMGAADFIIKPLDESYSTNLEGIRGRIKTILPQLQQKYKMLKGALDESKRAAAKRPVCKTNATKLSGVDIVVIAASTGGPRALELLVSKLPKDFNTPTLIVQHMPPHFTAILAESIDKKTHLQVLEGDNGEIVQNNKVIIAPGGIHMTVAEGFVKSKVVRLKDSESVNGVRPSADVLFESVAKVYSGARVLAVVMTGMGCDGAKGVSELKNSCKCYCLAQSEESCTVYGMSRVIVERNLYDEIVDLESLAERISYITKNGTG